VGEAHAPLRLTEVHVGTSDHLLTKQHVPGLIGARGPCGRALDEGVVAPRRHRRQSPSQLRASSARVPRRTWNSSGLPSTRPTRCPMRSALPTCTSALLSPAYTVKKLSPCSTITMSP